MSSFVRIKRRSIPAAMLLVPLTAAATAFTVACYEKLGYVEQSVILVSVAATTTQTLPDLPGVLDKDTSFRFIKSIVQIRRMAASGSGVILRSVLGADQVYRTYILTAAHVVNDSKFVQVIDFDYMFRLSVVSQTSYDAEVLATSKELDVALVEIRTERSLGRSVDLVTERDPRSVNLYDNVYAVGGPSLEPPSITDGHLAALERLRLRFSAPVAGGDSGGAVFLRDGRLIGIITGCLVQPGPGGVSVVFAHLAIGTPSPIIATWLQTSGAGFLVGDTRSSVESFERRRKS
jgi:S1-C subfamily serine protease